MISNPKYCPQCGAALQSRIVGDRARPVCPECDFVFYLNPIVAAGTLVERDGRVALVQRGVEPGRGLWGLPAGYAEADESAEEAAARETLEETHLHVEIDDLLDAYSYGRERDRGVLLVYAAHVTSGELEAGDDALDAQWFGPDELPEIAFRTHREALRKWRRARSAVYRRATVADAEVAVALAEVYLYGRARDYVRMVSDPNQELYAAVDGGQVVGFAGMIHDPRRHRAEIEQVFVHPRFRRWGIGTHLLKTCVEHGRAQGVRAVSAQVPVSNPGWTVYLKAGFRISGFTNDYYALGAEVPAPALLLTWDASR